MMHQVHLYGHLRDEFGPMHRFDVATPGEALRALNCAFPKRFVETMKQGRYRVVRGDPDEGMDLSAGMLNAFRLGDADLHLIPEALGSKGSSAKGTMEIIAGAAIIGAAIFFSGGTLAAPLAGMGSALSIGGVSLGITYGNVAMIGLAATLLGVSTLIAKPPVNNDATNSYTFSGPVNVDQQGNAVPLVFGLCMAGSQAISVNYQTEDIGSYVPINVTGTVSADDIAEDELLSALGFEHGLFGT